MRYDAKRHPLYAFTCLMFVCFACKNEDPKVSLDGTYAKEWTLDINEYLGLDGTTYEAVIIDQSRALVSHNAGSTGRLVEVNYVDGTFVREISLDNDSIRLVKSNEEVLLVHEQTGTKTYTLGLYDPNNDGEIKYFPTLKSAEVSPEDGTLMGLIPSPPETIYTYGTLPDDNGKPILWIANWYYDGPRRWTTEVNYHISVPIDPATFSAQVVTDRNLISTVETEHEGRKSVSILSVGAYDGYFDLMDPTAARLPIRHMVENWGTGFIYVFYQMGYSKLDLYGDKTFEDPMHYFPNGTLTTKPLVLFNSRLFLAVHEGDGITLASVIDQETKWTENYFERTTLPLTLLSTQKRDGVLVISSSGFITKYTSNQ